MQPYDHKTDNYMKSVGQEAIDSANRLIEKINKNVVSKLDEFSSKSKLTEALEKQITKSKVSDRALAIVIFLMWQQPEEDED